MPPATRSQRLPKKEISLTMPKAKNKDLPRGKLKKLNEQLSTSRLNVKELLTHLNHFNTHYRTGNLNGLSEVILAHPRVMEVAFRNLVNRPRRKRTATTSASEPTATTSASEPTASTSASEPTASTSAYEPTATTSASVPIAANTSKPRPKPLVLDLEFGIRRSFYMQLYYMLEKANIETTDDNLFEVLKRAMNHIMRPNPLMCMRTFLCMVPCMIKNERHSFVHEFLDVLQKVDDVLELGQTHLFRFKGQIIDIKARVEILHRLKYYLNEFLQHNNIQAHIPDEATTKIYDPSKMDVISLFNPIYTPNNQILMSAYSFLQVTTSWDDVGKFREYTDTTMTLLLGSWLEYMLLKVYHPKSEEQKAEDRAKEKARVYSETIITEEAAELLKYSLEIISLIWALVKYFNKKNPGLNIQDEFSSKYRWAYINIFYNGFPYVTSIATEQRNESALLVAQNLEICQVYILLYPNIDVKYRKNEIKFIINYIEDTFYSNIQAETNDIVLKIMQTLFSYEHNNWTSTLAITECLFSMIVWAYLNGDVSNSFRQKMFTLLCEIGVNEKLAHFHRSDAYQHWLKRIPSLMKKELVVLHTLGIIQRFADRNNITPNMVANSGLVKIIGTDPLPPPPIEPPVHEVDYRCLWLMECRDNENKHENRNICI